jgi:hypothetical protein
VRLLEAVGLGQWPGREQLLRDVVLGSSELGELLDLARTQDAERAEPIEDGVVALLSGFLHRTVSSRAV